VCVKVRVCVCVEMRVDHVVFTLHLTASHYNSLQPTAIHCNPDAATHSHCNARQTHCSSPQTQCNSLQPGQHKVRNVCIVCAKLTATHCNSLQLTANSLQPKWCHTDCKNFSSCALNSLQLTATHCNSLQLIATHCNSGGATQSAKCLRRVR